MWLEYVTLAIAFVGAVLGVLNTLHIFGKDRVKLRVLPAYAVNQNNPDINFAVQVVNLSTFAVFISEIGISYEGENSAGVKTIYRDQGPWPRRLEPRASIVVYGAEPESRPGRSIKWGYAKTECGHTKTGTSPSLENIKAGRPRPRALSSG